MWNRFVIVLYSDNKIVHEGYFSEDCFHGKGKEIDKEGNVWEGFFSKNSKNGKGLYTPIQGKDCMIEYSKDKVIKSDEYNCTGDTRVYTDNKTHIFFMLSPSSDMLLEFCVT